MGAWLTRVGGERVRTRLMGAFAALLIGVIALTAVGWWGMQRTQSELHAYEDEVLPQIAGALEIAERISRLAATAPNLADSRTAEALNTNAVIARGLLDEIRLRAQMIDSRGRLAPRIGPLIARGEGDLNQLTELTQTRHQLRSRLLAQMQRLERIGASLKPGRPDSNEALLAQLWSGLVLGASSTSPTTLGRLEADVESLMAAAHARNAFAGRDEEFRKTFEELTTGENSVLSLRHRLVDLEDRSDSLVALTRSNADKLSELVSAHVEQLRQVTQTRSALVNRALTSGQTGLFALTLICLAVAAGATLYVHKLVAQIEKITGVMSRLAGGDTSPATPARARRDELGALARTFDVFRDNLIAKQQLVAELRAQGELLTAVHNSMNDGLAVFDRERRLRLWNPALQQMLQGHGLVLEAGDRPERLLAQLPADARWRVPGQAERQPFRLDVLPPFADASHVEVYLPGQRVYDVRSQAMPDGGMVSLVTDLTERRTIETQLQHALRLDMLGRLTGGVAHDFHNHLGTIVGTLGLLQSQSGLDDTGRAQLARVQRAAERATALTRRLLAFARRQPLQAERVAIDSMIEEMADLIEYSAGSQVQVQLHLGSGDAVLHLDRGQLENALLNLVINSSAAMPAGGHLTVSTRRERVEGDWPRDDAVISVTDTGCGIPEALLDKVFEPFFTTKQGGDNASGEGEGSGLGLSIVHGFVHQSGGRVAIASRVGMGTTVSLRFPLAVDEPRTASPALPPPSGTVSDVAGWEILLVDDDEAFRATVSDMLRTLGCEVQAVGSPDEALALLEGAPHLPDLMLSDVRLGPDADGRKLAREVQREWPELPIGLMSGVPREALESPQLRIEWPFLLKPFDRSQLVAWLQDVRYQQRAAV